MSKSVRIRRGLNINLLGEADKVYASVKKEKNLIYFNVKERKNKKGIKY